MKDNKDKRKLKTEPRLLLKLNEEQKEVKRLFYQYDVNFIHGDYAAGKTFVACAIALAAFRKKEFNKIIIARPIVKNSVGILPGDIDMKMQPFVAPIIHNFNSLQSSTNTEKMISNLTLEILPVDFAKGITYVDSVVIIDEYEDLDYEDFRTMLTRLGKNSKMMFCGSKEQIHRSIGNKSCIYKAMELEDSGLVGYSTLKSNHRNPILTDIINFLEKDNVKVA